MNMRLFAFVLFLSASIFGISSAGSDSPLCRPLSLLHQMNKGPLPSKGSPRLVVIGDVHGDAHGLIQILKYGNVMKTTSIDSSFNCEWDPTVVNTTVIQMGDVVDRGKNTIEAFACIETLQKSHNAGNSIIRLIGNHEVMWLQGIFDFKNKNTDSKRNIDSIVERLKKGILDGKIVGAHSVVWQGIPFLFTHAGLRAAMKKHIISSDMIDNRSIANNEYFASKINSNLIRNIQSCMTTNCLLRDEIYGAGAERGGRSIGGSYWTDFDVLQTEARNNLDTDSFIQIVGHSKSLNNIRTTITMNAVCVDVAMYLGGRGYLEILDNGHVIAVHQERQAIKLANKKQWIRSDLSKQYCYDDGK